MPGRFERHQRSYVQWPTEPLYRWSLEAAREEYAATIHAIARFEPVTVIVRPEDRGSAAAMLSLGEEIGLLEMPLDDAWIRDSGPIFVRNDTGEVALVQFQFNGWGGRYASGNDMQVAPRLAAHLGMRCYEAPFICEGGGISVDGHGTLITTEQVMRNSNRYSGMSRSDVERGLLDYLGIEKVIWLERGLAEDWSTDGHVDNNVEFVSPGVLLLQTVIDPANPNYEICRQHLGVLKSARDTRGRRLEIIEVDQLPYTDAVHGGPHPAPCVNGYVINDAFLCPILDSEIDSAVHALLEKAYPNREIVPVPSTAISRDGGGIGCITQQQPAGPCANP